MYEAGPGSDCLPFSKTDKQSFENLVKYVNGIHNNPEGIKIKVKAIEKAAKRISGYKENSDELFKICK